MSVAFVQRVDGVTETSNTFVSPSFTPGAGNLLVCFFQWFHDNVNGTGMSTATFTDTAGNTWTFVETETTGVGGLRDGYACSIAYCIANGSSTVVTASLNQNRLYKGLTILEYSGASSTHKLTQEAQGNGTITTPSFSLDAGDLVLAAAWSFNGNNHSDFVSVNIIGTSGVTSRYVPGWPNLYEKIASAGLTGTAAITNNNGGIHIAYWLIAFAEAASLSSIAASKRTAILL